MAYRPDSVGGSRLQRNPLNLIDNRLIDDRVHHVAVMPADRPGRLRHEDHHQLLFRVGSPVGAIGARPGKTADRAGRAQVVSLGRPLRVRPRPGLKSHNTL